ncbi:dihydrodipicolinate synthase family protein [uncultured Agrococcus sp.]|uniref:dihydrodipicolinate synthase family protein n=1 Tax=uncultured Agrococcus sp. TaxID=382258 RepID=UPI0025E70431|nr:dihydrodipicolinate synthase family protein [uncultured Agrococcus sp.]
MTSPAVITAIPTAFTADGSVDLDASRAIFEFVAKSGNEGAFVLGTTGEFPALTVAERNELAKLAVETMGERMRVIVHVGAPSLFEVQQLIEGAREAGATEIAVITPYYLPVTDAALVDFFRSVNEAADGLRVFVYVYRKRAGNFVSVDVMTEISRLSNFVGAKVSEEPLELLQEYREFVPDDFVIYTGADADILRVANYGAQGVVSGVSSVLPGPFRAAAEGGAAPARLQEDVDLAVGAVGGDMERMRVALELQGVPAGTSRMALAEPASDARARIREAVERLGR